VVKIESDENYHLRKTQNGRILRRKREKPLLKKNPLGAKGCALESRSEDKQRFKSQEIKESRLSNESTSAGIFPRGAEVGVELRQKEDEVVSNLPREGGTISTRKSSDETQEKMGVSNL